MKLIAASILVLAGAVLCTAPQLLPFGVVLFVGSLVVLILIWRKAE